jgi:hypothetical protein
VAEGKPAPTPNEIRKGGDRRFTVPLFTDYSFRGSLPIPSVGIVRRIPYVNLYHKRVSSRRDFVIDMQPFLDAVKSPELYHFFGQDPVIEQESAIGDEHEEFGEYQTELNTNDEQ